MVLILAFPEAAAFLKQAKLQGLNVPAYGYAPTADEGLIKLAGDAADGFHAVSLTKPAHGPEPGDGGVPRGAQAVRAEGAALEQLRRLLRRREGVRRGPEDDQGRRHARSRSPPRSQKAGTIETGILPPLSTARTSTSARTQLQRVTVKDGKFVAEGEFITPPSGQAQ